MLTNRKHVREIIQLLEELGLKVNCVEHKTKHLKFRTTLPNGDEHTVFTSLTPSDNRVKCAIRSEVRRLLRNI